MCVYMRRLPLGMKLLPSLCSIAHKQGLIVTRLDQQSWGDRQSDCNVIETLLQYLTRGFVYTPCQLVRKACNLHLQANGTCLKSEPGYSDGRHVYIDFVFRRWSQDTEVTNWEALILLRISFAIWQLCSVLWHVSLLSSIILFCFRQQWEVACILMHQCWASCSTQMLRKLDALSTSFTLCWCTFANFTLNTFIKILSIQ